MEKKQFQILMNKVLSILIIISLLSLRCNIDNKQIEMSEDKILQKKMIKNEVFIFDTSINKQLFLRDPSSVMQTLGNIMPLMSIDADFPYAHISNNVGDQYLKMFFFPGDEANCISQFEVGLKDVVPSTIKMKSFSFDSFYTESKIMLGMTKSQIMDIKGTDYEEIVEDDILLIRYVIDDPSFTFLKRYNMPTYITEYWIKDDRLLKYRFGFEYP